MEMQANQCACCIYLPVCECKAVVIIYNLHRYCLPEGIRRLALVRNPRAVAFDTSFWVRTGQVKCSRPALIA